MVSTSGRTGNLHSRCFLKEGFIRLMRVAKNGDVRCNDSFLVLLWSTLRRMMYEKRSFFTVYCVLSTSGILKKMLIFSLNFVSFCLPCLSPFFGFYLPVLYYSYFFLVCISLPISSILSWFSFLFLFRVFLPFFRRWVFPLPFFCPFAFQITVVLPYFLIYFYLFLLFLFFTFCLFLLRTTLHNHIPTFFPLISYMWQSDGLNFDLPAGTFWDSSESCTDITGLYFKLTSHVWTWYLPSSPPLHT